MKSPKIKIISCLIACLLTLTACSDSKPAVLLDNSDNSTFIDFYSQDGTVYIECELNIYNSGADGVKVKISAVDDDDVKIGLLKSPLLIGKTETGEETLTLAVGENKIKVIFSGEFAGINQITSRSIPRFINIELV